MRRHGGLEHGTAEEVPDGSGDRMARLALHRCVAVAGPRGGNTHGAFTDFGRWSDFLHFQALWRALFPTAVQRMIPKGVGNHFPMGDDTEQVAAWIRDWHATAVATGASRPEHHAR